MLIMRAASVIYPWNKKDVGSKSPKKILLFFYYGNTRLKIKNTAYLRAYFPRVDEH